MLQIGDCVIDQTFLLQKNLDAVEAAVCDLWVRSARSSTFFVCSSHPGNRHVLSAPAVTSFLVPRFWPLSLLLTLLR